MTIYYSPEQYGLTTVGEVEWREPCYSFDLTAVWRDESGALYWADDSGCSCPSPFEDYDRSNISSGDVSALESHLNKHLAETDGFAHYWYEDSGSEDSEKTRARTQMVDLIARIRSAA